MGMADDLARCVACESALKWRKGGMQHPPHLVLRGGLRELQKPNIYVQMAFDAEGEKSQNHFVEANKVVLVGSGVMRTVSDCYLEDKDGVGRAAVGMFGSREINRSGRFPEYWGMASIEKRNSGGLSARRLGADPRENGPIGVLGVVGYAGGLKTTASPDGSLQVAAVVRIAATEARFHSSRCSAKLKESLPPMTM